MRGPSPFTVGAVAIALGLVINLATDTIQVEAPWWDPAVWAALAVLFVVVVRIEWTRVPESTVNLDQAADDLAEAVASQWRAEVNARGFGHLDPIRLRWSATSRPVTPSPAELLDDHQRPAAPVKVTRLRLSGDLADMTQALGELPFRQLVVIGSPGAGKSTLAVLLTLGLLKRRQPCDPVPVLMTVSSWDPDREHLDAWLVRRLGELYPALSRRGRYGTDTAVRLVDRGLVMPILDGLDEMPRPVQARAITALTVAVGRDRSLVLTSRADEYHAAVAAAGSPLARAAVVDLEPVTAADAAVYLTAGQIDGEARWRPVLDHLAAFPDGPLARTLRTPLMVYLARIAYHRPGSDHAGLLAFPEADAIERHLLDAYLPAVYAPRTAPPRTQHTSVATQTYTVHQARRWLAFLADHMTREQTADLAWWRLHRAIPHLSLVVGLLSGLALSPIFWIGYGFKAGLIAVLLGGFMGWRSGVINTPRQIQVNLRKLVKGIVFGLVFGLVFGFLGGFLFGRMFGLMVGPVFGLVAFAVGLGVTTALSKTVTPTSTLKSDRKISLIAGCGGLLLGLASGLTGVVAFGVVVGLVILVVVLVAGLQYSWAVGSWPPFVVVRLFLAVRRQLPFRLMPFLEDAYRLGVLRKVGAVYQFRHARLQEHLATLHRTNP